MTPPGTMAITGASGMIGRALCTHFAKKGWRVRALVRDPGRVTLPLLEGVEVCACDLPTRLDVHALAGASVIIHAAYTTRFRTLADARRTNEDGTRLLADAASRAGVPRFVFVSSIAAQEGARSYYGQSKLALECELVERFGAARVLNIRPGLVLSLQGGLFARIAAQVGRARFVPVIAGGDPNLQPVHIDDLVRGVDLALQSDLSGCITMALPEAVTYRQLVDRTAAHLGRRVRCVPLPGRAVLMTLRLLERAGARLAFSSENLLGLLGQRRVDTTADLARLNLRLRTLDESLADLLAPPRTTVDRP